MAKFEVRLAGVLIASVEANDAVGARSRAAWLWREMRDRSRVDKDPESIDLEFEFDGTESIIEA